MSYGDVDYIKIKYSETVKRALFEDVLLRRKTYDEFDPYFGFFNSKVFSVSLYNLYMVFQPNNHEEIKYYKKIIRKLKYNSDEVYE